MEEFRGCREDAASQERAAEEPLSKAAQIDCRISCGSLTGAFSARPVAAAPDGNAANGAPDADR